MQAERRIVIPYAPRPLQQALHGALDKHRFVVAVCHRRFGKTVLAVNQLVKKALLCERDRPRFAYVAPTYRMGKAIAWDYLKHYSQPIPGQVVNESELRIDYPNGGQVRIYGADNPDALRGIYLDGVVLDEYGLMAPNVFGEIIRPLLTDRQGWALFIGTPNGQNQFYKVAQDAQSTPGWYFAAYKASETNIIHRDELADARRSMTADEYAQEFECSFEASVKGAVFAREMQIAREDGRISIIPYDARLPVDTWWDLGVGDATAIWFTQTSPGGELRCLNYYEKNGVGLQHYAGVLREYRDTHGYSYGSHWAPHDIEVKELGTGQSRIEIARTLGISFRVAKKLSLEDGINAARMLLPRCWFDSVKCKRGIEAMQAYRWDWNTRINEFKALPVHDWASHGADAFRTGAVAHFSPVMERKQNEARRDFDPADKYYGKNMHHWKGTPGQSRGGW